MKEEPVVDERASEGVIEEAEAIAPYYTDDWDPGSGDVGAVLLELFAELTEDVIERLNRVPEKHRISFFDTLGFSRHPPQPSRLPLSFRVADGVDENVAIRAGTQAIAEAEGAEQTFEIAPGDGFEAAPATIERAYSVDPSADGIFEHWKTLQGGGQTALFGGENLQKHALYIGHGDLLNLQPEPEEPDPTRTVTVEIETSERMLRNQDRLLWQYYGKQTEDGEEGWYGVATESWPAAVSDGTVEVTLTLPAGAKITEREVSGIESRWLRCQITGEGSPEELFSVEVDSVHLGVGAGADGISPDALLYNDVPLETKRDDGEPLFPLGEIPRQLDTFYVASEEAFTKKETAVELKFEPGKAGNQSSVTFTDQSSDGTTLMVDSVTVPDGGFVAIYVDVDIVVSVPTSTPHESIVGVSDYLEPGTHKNVEITPFEELRSAIDSSEVERNQTMIAVAHRDTDDDEEFDYVDTEGQEDDPYTDDSGEPVSDTAVVTLSRDATPGPDPRLSWEYWNGSGWARLDIDEDGTDQLARVGTVRFEVPSDLESTGISGHDGYWIRARLVAGDYGEVRYKEVDDDESWQRDTRFVYPPCFGGVTIRYDQTRPAEHLVSENNREYRKRPTGTERFRPFYGLRDEKQTLYLGFDRPLDDGPIHLLFSMEEKEYPEEFYPRVRWEYRSDPGSDGWSRLEARDGTESLTERGIVALVFAEETTAFELFGEERHWIRARLTEEEFLSDASADPTELPIVITDIDPERERITVENTGDRTVDLSGVQVNFEHGQLVDQIRTFPKGTTIAPGESIDVATGTKSTGTADVRFDYDRWVINTEETDTVAILTPQGDLVTQKSTQTGVSEPRRETSSRPEPCTGTRPPPEPCDVALETEPPAGAPSKTPPILRGIHLNAGWAYNVRTVGEEILGSSDGSQNQEFVVSTPPVTEEEVWVDELAVLSEGQREALTGNQPSRVEEVTGPEGAPSEFWVRWTRVEDFLDSEGDDRHYTVDRSVGLIAFGDGVNGKIPPRGRDNVRTSYKTGGGVGGNVREDAVTGLVSALPFVDSVTNPEPGDGGADAESVAQVVTRAPKELRDRGKAVTKADFERIATTAARELARAKCIPGMDDAGEYSPGWVTLLIVPKAQRNKPVPSVELKHQVLEAVSERAPAPLVGPERVTERDEKSRSVPEIVVRGPSYVEVTVEATVEANGVGSVSTLEERVTRETEAFLHPLSGGETGEGWEFGELPCLSDLYAVLEGVEGVDHVETLAVTFRGSEEAVRVTEGEPEPDVSSDALIFSGTHEIQATGGL